MKLAPRDALINLEHHLVQKGYRYCRPKIEEHNSRECWLILRTNLENIIFDVWPYYFLHLFVPYTWNINFCLNIFFIPLLAVNRHQPIPYFGIKLVKVLVSSIYVVVHSQSLIDSHCCVLGVHVLQSELRIIKLDVLLHASDGPNQVNPSQEDH